MKRSGLLVLGAALVVGCGGAGDDGTGADDVIDAAGDAAGDTRELPKWGDKGPGADPAAETHPDPGGDGIGDPGVEPTEGVVTDVPPDGDDDAKSERDWETLVEDAIEESSEVGEEIADVEFTEDIVPSETVETIPDVPPEADALPPEGEVPDLPPEAGDDGPADLPPEPGADAAQDLPPETVEANAVQALQQQAASVECPPPPPGNTVIQDGVTLATLTVTSPSYRASTSLDGYFARGPGPNEPWNGIMLVVATGTPGIGPGTRLDATGAWKEYWCMTELSIATWQPVEPGEAAGAPWGIPAQTALDESLEGVLVTLADVAVASANPDAPDDFGAFELAGGIRVGNLFGVPYMSGATDERNVGDVFASVTGVVHYSYGEFRLMPRSGRTTSRSRASPTRTATACRTSRTTARTTRTPTRRTRTRTGSATRATRCSTCGAPTRTWS